MTEEKNKNNKTLEDKKKQDDCPLCSISLETIAALKKAKDAKDKENKMEAKK